MELEKIYTCFVFVDQKYFCFKFFQAINFLVFFTLNIPNGFLILLSCPYPTPKLMPKNLVLVKNRLNRGSSSCFFHSLSTIVDRANQKRLHSARWYSMGWKLFDTERFSISKRQCYWRRKEQIKTSLCLVLWSKQTSGSCFFHFFVRQDSWWCFKIRWKRWIPIEWTTYCQNSKCNCCNHQLSVKRSVSPISL